MDKKAELSIPADKLKIALATTIVLFAFVFILVILSIIFSPGEVQKFISNPLEALGGTKGEVSKAEIGNVTLSCSDSDGGQEFNIEGFAINSSGSIFEDNCTSQTALREYYCKNGNVTFTSSVCANSCIGGACTDYKWNCTDSDGGLNLNKSGNIAGVQKELNRLIFAMDSCISNPTNATKVSSGGFINEYFCTGKYINSSVFGCSSGCINGICNGTSGLLNCNACLAQNKNYSCFSGGAVSCSLTFNASKCFDCRGEICGNSICSISENFLNCNKDCSILSCGNKRCDNPFENEGNCPFDCRWHCGNGVCDDGETLSECAIDCGVNKTSCGNGVCEPPVETLSGCAKDCRGSMCGNGICEFGETNAICSGDCKLNTCGNGVCDYGVESVHTCPQDCIIFCGNGVCEFGENSQNCQVDCFGGICNSDTDCFPGNSCVNHRCVESSCTRDADCHSNEKCVNSVCLSECTIQSDCGSGRQCKNGFCSLIATLSVTQPNGGETLILGQTYDIKWIVSTGVNRVSLYLIPEVGTPKTLVSGIVASTGKWSWQIPSSSSSGIVPGKYKIKIVNSADNTGQDSSNDWFSISAPANALPRLNSVSPANGKPGDLVTIFGEGFDTSSNRVIFKIVNSPFSFYNGKAGVEYLAASSVASTDGKTLQVSIPQNLNQLDDTSASIITVPGTYQILVSNSSSGGVRSNPVSLLINDYLNLPTKIQITSPKAGDIWSVEEQKTITWTPISNVGRVSLYVQTIPYRSKDNDKETVYYFKTINSSIVQSGGSFEWNVNFGDGDKQISTYASAELVYGVPWLPLDGNLESYISIEGKDNAHAIFYKDLSEAFTIDTLIVGSCNECPGGGYAICDGASSKKSCSLVGECLKWSTTACGSGQSCTNGVCGGTGITSCTSGAKRCSGTLGYQTCSSTGSWGTTTSCSSGQTCSGSGVCGAGAGGACSKYPGAWYQVSPPGSIGCEAFCANRGLQSSGDFVGNVVLQKYFTSNGNEWRDEGPLIVGETLCHTSDWSDSGGGYGSIQDAKSISSEFNLALYLDAEKEYSTSYLMGGRPGYGENLFEYAGIQGCAGSTIQAAVDKCYCRDTSKDVNCPSGLYCNGVASGTCVKTVCGNGVCESGETEDSCEIGPSGCYNPSMYYGDTSCILNKGTTCTATLKKGSCGADCGSLSSCSTSTYSLTRCTCSGGKLSCVY